MEKIHVKDRDIVIPGDLLAEGMEFLPTGKAMREENKIFATTMGLVSVKGHVIKVIPLAGRYIPKKKDIVVGKIAGIGKFGWAVDIRSPFDADLHISEASYGYIDTRRTPMNKIYGLGDYVLCGVYDISESRYVKLTMRSREYRKLVGGIVIEVSPTKIPRIIGKQGSMIRTLKEGSGCEIYVGQNGWIWVKGEPEKQMLAVNAIKKIEKESHTSGLTDKIAKMFGIKEVKEVKEVQIEAKLPSAQRASSLGKEKEVK